MKMHLATFLPIRLAQSFVYRHISSVARVCIVGSGPSGFYTAKYLLNDNNVCVDVLEKLPVPYGNCTFLLIIFERDDKPFNCYSLFVL